MSASFRHRPGISNGFLAKAGVTVLPNPERLHIPYHDIEGRPTGHYRDRFKTAVTAADGKPQRYSQPFESAMHAYIPPIPLVKGEDLFVTEGEFKSLALAEAGFNAGHRTGHPIDIFARDSDTLFNLDLYRSAASLADAFQDIPIRLIQPPLDGLKGVDDAKDETSRRFNRRLDS